MDKHHTIDIFVYNAMCMMPMQEKFDIEEAVRNYIELRRYVKEFRDKADDDLQQRKSTPHIHQIVINGLSQILENSQERIAYNYWNNKANSEPDTYGEVFKDALRKMGL